MKTKLTRIAALLIAVIMLAGIAACSAADNNPGIGKVGKVSFTLADYMTYYQQYAQYASYFPDLNNTIKEQLIRYGVTLNHCYEIGLELDEEEEAKLAETVQKNIDTAVDSMTVDSSITGDDAIYQAKLEAFVAKLKENGYKSLDQYKKLVEEDERKTMLINKLRDQVNAEVEFGSAQVQEYYDTNAPKHKEDYEKDASAFATAYNSYITGQGVTPLFVPEDMFTVKHVLVQYANASSVSDTVEGVFEDAQEEKLSAIRTALENGISFEDFVNTYVNSTDYNSDTALVPKTLEEGEEPETVETNPQVGYQQHGYIMNENLLDRYYDGFGVAACMLYYGENWTVPEKEQDNTDTAITAAPTAEPTPDPDATPAPDGEGDRDQTLAEKYSIKFYETTDHHKIAEVKTSVANGGIHFVYVQEELTPGVVSLDINDTESDVYTSIEKIYRAELENTHYSEVYETWKANTRIALNDSYIDNYARNYLGLK